MNSIPGCNTRRQAVFGVRVKHRIEFLDGLHQPIKPQIIKFRLYVQLRSAVELGEPLQMNDSFGFTAGRHHYV
jgi:hypothetical protein